MPDILTAQEAYHRYLASMLSNNEQAQEVLNNIADVCSTNSGCIHNGELEASTIAILKGLGHKVTDLENGTYAIDFKIIDMSETYFAQTMTQFELHEEKHVQTQKKVRLNTILCIVIMILILLLGSVVFITTQTKQVGLVALLDTPNQSFDIPDWDPDAIIPPADETVQKLNEKLDMGKMCINMLSKVVFENTYSYGTMNIYNDEANNYPQFVTITKDSNGVIIYQSGLIEVGKGIPYAALDVEVPVGEHECTAVFTQVDPATNKVCGQAAAKVTIVIKE